MAGRRKFWGWGVEGQGPSEADIPALAQAVSTRLGVEPPAVQAVPALDRISLPSVRIAAPDALAGMCSTDPFDRASHTYGKAFRDVVRALRGDFSAVPDIVARPSSEEEVMAVLDWCATSGYAVIPFGGGSSVVGGVELRERDAWPGYVSLDLSEMSRLVELDRTSRAACFEAGVFGPALEDRLRGEGLTLRHYPQSFEYSTLGGWIATRSGGHFATGPTHIEDFVESVRAVTPAGILETRRLPGSGAGPSPDRLLAGSEGILGVITSAWMRLQDRPVFRASCVVTYADFPAGAEAVRHVVQSGLQPTNCRLLDPTEALTSGAGTGEAAVLLLAFESAHVPVGTSLQQARDIAVATGGQAGEMKVVTPDSRAGGDSSADAWRHAFLQMPYLRDALVRLGLVTDTFETAVTWDRFAEFHATVTARVQAALDEVCGAGWLACRFTHAYPDGCAPYYTVVGASTPDHQLEAWDEIKAAASEAVLASGGTITHHHAVGRDHRPWYDRQRPDVFAAALRAAKRAVDPAGVLNPGVLVD
ncbi:MAG: FAD-binding oxidoreductase [Acidimicrobiia bacterium]|nr:FAD-binding oxidoreductase [Acidimicrobiia bacterium]